MSERDFWKSTAFAVIQAYNAHQENLSRLAYRTAVYQRMNHKHLPKNEEAIFAKQAKRAKRQTAKDQFAMAKFITQMMSKEVH